MPKQPKKRGKAQSKPPEVIWEVVEDKDVNDLIQRVIRMVLTDSGAREIDQAEMGDSV